MIRKEELADDIVDKIKRDNIEDLKSKLKEINDKELISMIYRRMLDPGQGFIKKKNTKIAFSYYPSSNEYRLRFAITTIISFINSMLDEWEPNVDGEYISEKDEKFMNIYNKIEKDVRYKMSLHSLEQRLAELTDKSEPNNDAIFRLRAEIIKTKQCFDDLADYQNEYKALVREYKVWQMQMNIAPKRKQKRKSDPFGDVGVNLYELTDEDVDYIKYYAMKELNITDTKESRARHIKKYVADFLDYYFSYNPDNHVRAKYKPHYSNAFLSHIQSVDEDERKELCNRFRLQKMSEFNRNLIPPEDTFIRLHRYMDANYDELRQATDDIYPEYSVHKSVEDCIIMYDVISGKDEDDVAAKQQKFLTDNEYMFVGKPLWTEFGRWTLITPSSESLNKTDMGARNEFLRSLNTKYESDRKMGYDMMKKRIDNDKKKLGDDVPKEERILHKGQCEDQGIKHIDDVERELYFDIKDIPADIRPPDNIKEDQVKIINIGAAKGSNRFDKRIDVTKWHVNVVMPAAEKQITN